jgi:hypothetical protein
MGRECSDGSSHFIKLSSPAIQRAPLLVGRLDCNKHFQARLTLRASGSLLVKDKDHQTAAVYLYPKGLCPSKSLLVAASSPGWSMAPYGHNKDSSIGHCFSLGWLCAFYFLCWQWSIHVCFPERGGKDSDDNDSGVIGEEPSTTAIEGMHHEGMCTL